MDENILKNAADFGQKLAVSKKLFTEIDENSSKFDILHLDKRNFQEVFSNITIALR